MRKLLRIATIVASAAALVILLLVWDASGWWPISVVHGQVDARIDLARGRYKVLGAGLPVPWRSAYAALLRQRYNVELKVEAGCIVSKSLSDYMVAYNQVSMDAANRKFGHDIFKEVSDEAAQNWKHTALAQRLK